MFRKYFTPQEANKRLPLVKKIVSEILAKGQTLKKIVTKTPKNQWPPEVPILEAEIQVLIAELEELGCYFKDWNFELGLVDFPSRMDGEEVMLCWRSDEERLGWYHSLTEGYAGRKPIADVSARKDLN